MMEDRVPKRPYRDSRLRKERMVSATALKTAWEAKKAERCEAAAAENAPCCYICGRVDHLRKITAPGIVYHFCPAHYNELASVTTLKIEEMKATYLGDVDAGISTPDS